ncbi:MAG: alpha/beta hydrolase [Synechococcus sp. ArSW.bin.68]
MSWTDPNPDPQLLKQLGVAPFEQRLPWWGGDLQTLRDTFRPVDLPIDQGQPIEIQVPALSSGAAGSGALLAFLDCPPEPKAVVVILHGLGGSSRREGVRRLGVALGTQGFAVLRLNMRGADPGRHLAGGTYAAQCNSDLLPVLYRARQLCSTLTPEGTPMPLFGAGLSLGGTMLLNACLSTPAERVAAGLDPARQPLDGLFCASSPLDLAACSASIERPRNHVYQRWLLQRLVRQTLADPFGVSDQDLERLSGAEQPRTIRAFDSSVTAPRWGFVDVDAYYREASPLQHLIQSPQHLPPTLMLQALDDPWVPARSALDLREAVSPDEATDQTIQLIFTREGGHNGFHGRGGCWADALAASWLQTLK